MSTFPKNLVINFHMTEVCNYRCAYCYAKWHDDPQSNELHRQEGKVDELLTSLAEHFLSPNPLQDQLGYQGVRINFAGGEPMVLGKQFIAALRKAKALGFSTSIITNGHFLHEDTLAEVAPMLDMLGISFDTADELIAHSIGRSDRRRQWLSPARLATIAAGYRALNPAGTLKINTVVNPFNWRENLLAVIEAVRPDKWKLLRVLPVHDVRQVITDEQYDAYVTRHHSAGAMVVVEDNEAMWQSYLMVNPLGRFYQNSAPGQGHIKSDPILKVGVARAFSQIPFNADAFARRYR
ncbi:MAG: viperin family antiviral radical SAM protein [Alcanivorax sp.]|nr:viperin family antiviral radical SAM protein [Alcanivorax sp.]